MKLTLKATAEWGFKFVICIALQQYSLLSFSKVGFAAGASNCKQRCTAISKMSLLHQLKCTFTMTHFSFFLLTTGSFYCVVHSCDLQMCCGEIVHPRLCTREMIRSQCIKRHMGHKMPLFMTSNHSHHL